MAYEKIARTILREIPVAAIGRFVEIFEGADLRANGNNCGNACGNNCIDGTGFVIDRYGYIELKDQEVRKAQGDLAGLREAIQKEATRMLKG
jgi:hypothetical protein